LDENELEFDSDVNEC